MKLAETKRMHPPQPTKISPLRVVSRILGVLCLGLAFTVLAFSENPAPQASSPSAPRVSQSKSSAQVEKKNSADPDDKVASLTTSTGTEPATQEKNGQYTIQTNVNEVNLIFTVTNKHGRFIRNLKQQDFALLDDQRAPAQIYSFTQQTNLPLRVGILIDTSTSIRRRFHFEQQAAIGFLQSVIRPSTDLAFVMGFDTTAYVTQPYTSDEDLLQQGIDKLEPGGGTALYDAVYKACRNHLLSVPNSPQYLVRKALILISDGDDNQSHAYPSDAIKMCQRAGAAIFAISTNTSPTRDRGDAILKEMAVATGGRAFIPHSLEDMASSFHNIEEELRSEYALAYRPADFKADGSFRTIYLVALNHGYVVHARKGYFAPKAPKK